MFCVQQKFSSKLKQASRRLERLACFGDDGDGSDDVYRIWVGVCKKDRHHRHQRHAYSEMTLAVYYCSKKIMILRETQNQNDADDANDAESGIWYRDILKTASQASSASRSSRKDTAGGLGDTPEMRLWISKRYACKTRLPPKR